MHRDRDLFWKLLEPEHERLQAFCRRLSASREDGDDLCQEALTVAWQRFGDLRDRSSFKAWVYRIAVTRFRNHCRRAFWKRFVSLENGSAPEPAGPDPQSALETGRLLDRALGSLIPDDRALTILFELEGWSVAELARLQGRTEQATRVRLFRARQRMKNTLERFLARCELQNRKIESLRKEELCVVVKPSVD